MIPTWKRLAGKIVPSPCFRHLEGLVLESRAMPVCPKRPHKCNTRSLRLRPQSVVIAGFLDPPRVTPVMAWGGPSACSDVDFWCTEPGCLKPALKHAMIGAWLKPCSLTSTVYCTHQLPCSASMYRLLRSAPRRSCPSENCSVGPSC